MERINVSNHSYQLKMICKIKDNIICYKAEAKNQRQVLISYDYQCNWLTSQQSFDRYCNACTCDFVCSFYSYIHNFFD